MAICNLRESRSLYVSMAYPSFFVSNFFISNAPFTYCEWMSTDGLCKLRGAQGKPQSRIRTRLFLHKYIMCTIATQIYGNAQQKIEILYLINLYRNIRFDENG